MLQPFIQECCDHSLMLSKRIVPTTAWFSPLSRPAGIGKALSYQLRNSRIASHLRVTEGEFDYWFAMVWIWFPIHG
ncbi:hypothetical protein X797_003704 [Metarhizium robertsii]|uniref:Uncharacterized protein n=1 Tax=Metarhizium robertsii TaxID=568076 RepID=A0A0A1UX29_9HYPO|nr:hypothetical protein X797_003704 [Metarhizium robertsii]